VSVVDAKPVMTIREVRIGTVRVPGFLLNGITKLFSQKNVDEFTATIAQVANLSDVELRRGLVIVSGTLATGVVNGR
jgi:hypothetical protein